MLHEVQTLAAIMQDFGVSKGDRVILYMPMVPEAVVAMLACARIGAVHSVVFGGFAAKELATRIEDAKPKLIFSASCGLEPGRIVQYKPLLDEAIRLSSVKPEACIILQRPQHGCELIAGRDHDWCHAPHQGDGGGRKSAGCVPLQDDAGLRLDAGETDRLVEQRLVLHDAAGLEPATRREDQLRLGVLDPGRKLLRREAAEHHAVHRPDPRASQHRDHGFRYHRHIEDDAVPLETPKSCMIAASVCTSCSISA